MYFFLHKNPRMEKLVDFLQLDKFVSIMSGKLGRLNAVIALLNDVKTMQSKVK